ncbi:hypothetical protein [Trichormus sp. NMC-1]|uniref:hypothetical protein n=1 Tax=Trichormus sp. NMC-1 TaxID=1853259 RepID=UPI0008DBF7C6|nr:hypothetical protein [Trichormus sp. NMC-1]
MLAPHQPPDLDAILDSEDSTQINQETARYLNHIETKLYADIQTRRRIDSGLLFIACQFSSCSLSWLLFNLQVTLSIIQVTSAVVSLMPGLVDMGDSFNFSLSSESWEFSLGQKPLVGLIKLIIGGAVSMQGTSKITAEIINTQSQIAQTYNEIRSSEGLSFQLPNMGFSLLIGLGAIALIGMLKKFSSTTNNNEGESE